MKEILERLKKLIGTISGGKEGLPDLAALDKESAAAAAVKNCGIHYQSLTEAASQLEALALAADEESRKPLSDDAKAAVLEEFLTAGAVIRKSDADAAQQTAVTARETSLRTEFETARKQDEAASAARAKLAETCGVSLDVVARVPAETCAATDFETVASAKIADRIKKFKDLGIDEPATLQEVCAMGTDAVGDTAFDAKFAQFKAVADKWKSGGPAAPFGTPPKSAAPLGGGMAF